MSSSASFQDISTVESSQESIYISMEDMEKVDYDGPVTLEIPTAEKPFKAAFPQRVHVEIHRVGGQTVVNMDGPPDAVRKIVEHVRTPSEYPDTKVTRSLRAPFSGIVIQPTVTAGIVKQGSSGEGLNVSPHDPPPNYSAALEKAASLEAIKEALAATVSQIISLSSTGVVNCVKFFSGNKKFDEGKAMQSYNAFKTQQMSQQLLKIQNSLDTLNNMLNNTQMSSWENRRKELQLQLRIEQTKAVSEKYKADAEKYKADAEKEKTKRLILKQKFAEIPQRKSF